MTTYFETISKSFADVPVTAEGVDTVAFLEASEGLVKMFDLLGKGAFTVVQSDLTGNIAKVRARYDAFPDKSKTLEELVISEKTEKKRTATEGLLWLLRGLHFTQVGMQNSFHKDEELSVSFNKGYETTLKQHHSFVVRPIFSLAMKACPYRKDFYEKLGAGRPNFATEFEKWLAALTSIVKHMQDFYAEGGHSKGL